MIQLSPLVLSQDVVSGNAASESILVSINGFTFKVPNIDYIAVDDTSIDHLMKLLIMVILLLSIILGLDLTNIQSWSGR